MPKTKTNTEVYAEIMSEIAMRAVAKVDGIQLVSEGTDKSKIIKDNDIHAYFFSENSVNIDVYLDIEFGLNIPDTVCKVQQAIKNAIEKETCYKVGEVNVSVVSIYSKGDEKPVEIVHEFSEDEEISNEND